MEVFYSWQNDTNNKYNRSFIKDCLESAIKKINSEIQIDEAVRLDHDTKDISGIPDITNTIYSKIQKCSIFIGDITFVAQNRKRKKFSNPNVLIELGYALNCLSDSCIINVLNESYGNPKNNLPFDLAHKRWPIIYALNEKNCYEKDFIKAKLVSEFCTAIKSVILFKKSIDKLLPITDDPSIENIKLHIMNSNSKMDWSPLMVGSKNINTYNKNANLRIEIDYSDKGTHERNFTEPWANCFLHKNATSYWCLVYYSQTIIYQTVVVSVDGGLSLLPIPTKIDSDEKLLLVEVLNYKIAELFDINEQMYSYFVKSGLRINSGID